MAHHHDPGRSCNCAARPSAAGQSLNELQFTSRRSLHKALADDLSTAFLTNLLNDLTQSSAPRGGGSGGGSGTGHAGSGDGSRSGASSIGGGREALWRLDSAGWAPVLYCRSVRTFILLLDHGLLETRAPLFIPAHATAGGGGVVGRHDGVARLAQAVTPDGRRSILHRAVVRGDGELVQGILDAVTAATATGSAGGRTQVRNFVLQLDADGLSALQLAAKLGKTDIEYFLCEYAGG